MRKDKLAEDLLTLVTTRERAVTIVGDLVEVSQETGRFWPLVARTAAHQLWGQFTAAPGAMLRAGLRIQFLELGLAVVFGIPFILGLALLVAISHAVYQAYPPRSLLLSLGMIFWGAISFQVGRVIARRYPGRELAVLCSLLALQHVIGAIAEFGFLMARGATPAGLVQTAGSSLGSTVLDLLVVGGGIFYQRAKLRRFMLQ